MKYRIFSLVLGMIVILGTMAATSCARTLAQNDEFTEVVAGAPAGAGVVTVSDDGVFADQELATVDAEPGLLSWPTILSFVLLLLSSIFGVYWSKASRVLNTIYEGLQPGSPGGKTLTATEIKKIVDAWKGK